MSAFEHGYALVVGVAGYNDPALPTLPLAVLNDAVDFACALWNPEICGYRADRVRVLLDEQATAEGFLQGLNWLYECCEEDDEGTVVIFFSGHGWNAHCGSYLAAYDARIGQPNAGMIAGEELTNRLQAIQAERMAVFLDCCHSGGIAEIKGLVDSSLPRAYVGALDERTYEGLRTGNGRVLFASSGASETSSVRRGDRNSLFTSCLLRGLRGEAGAADEEVLGVLDLFAFISKEVSLMSSHYQEPLMKAEVSNNFPIALRRRTDPDKSERRKKKKSIPKERPIDLAGRDIIKVRNVDKLRTGRS